MSDKQILVVPSRPCQFFGLSPVTDESSLVAYWNNNGQALERSIAEVDFGFRQVIPYVTIGCPAVDGGTYLLAYERLKGGNENRLHNQFSLGFGGHVKWQEGETPASMVFRTVSEELYEELGLEIVPVRLSLLSEISADLTEVDRVHSGAHFHYELPQLTDELLDLVSPEPDKIRLFWTHSNFLPLLMDRFETWSKLVATTF